MEFSSRVACIKYYQEEYPNLPRYMIEMALDYDLSNGGTSNEKPLTGKQKRKQKQMKKKVEKRDTGVQDLIQDAVNSGKPIEIDSVGIVRKEDYVMPPFVKGYISVEGLVPPEPEPEPEDTSGKSTSKSTSKISIIRREAKPNQDAAEKQED